jgi:hypothetical protein
MYPTKVNDKIKATFHSDPGHGWMAVGRKHINALGIADKISASSYQKGQTVYLEEDCDLTVFFHALAQANGVDKTNREAVIALKHKVMDIKDSYQNKSPLRNYDSYRFNPETDLNF